MNNFPFFEKENLKKTEQDDLLLPLNEKGTEKKLSNLSRHQAAFKMDSNIGPINSDDEFETPPKHDKEEEFPAEELIEETCPEDREQWGKILNLSNEVSEMIQKAIQSDEISSQTRLRVKECCRDLFSLVCQDSFVFGTRKHKQAAPLIRPPIRNRKISRPSKNSKSSIDPKNDPNKKKRRKRAQSNPNNLYCHACGVKDTPEWRRGPDGCKSLCNACGLHYAKIVKREQESFISQPRSIPVNMLID